MTQVAAEGLDVSQTDRVNRKRWFGSRRLEGLARRATAMRAVPHLGTWIGIALIVGGIVLLVLAWAKTAGIANSVALQLPYLISAGFSGIALVLLGVTSISIDAKRSDAAERRRQLAELRGLLTELRVLTEDDQR